jgi:L-fucose isomerase-like protein
MKNLNLLGPVNLCDCEREPTDEELACLIKDFINDAVESNEDCAARLECDLRGAVSMVILETEKKKSASC